MTIDGHLVKMSLSDFEKLSKYTYEQFGIKMPISKKTLLESRLMKRLKYHGFENYTQYINHLFSKEGGNTEWMHFIDNVSTNKTDFFREPTHFEFLSAWIKDKYSSSRLNGDLKIWSSASSSGEEIYTIAMVVSESLPLEKRNAFQVLGTDISGKMLEIAHEAIYDEARIVPIPENYRKKYLLKGKDPNKPLFRICPELRSKTRFQKLNLMDKTYPVAKEFDVIFCRNVLIYFDKKTQENVINHLCEHLKPEGILILGHSESVIGMNLPITAIKPSIYKLTREL